MAMDEATRQVLSNGAASRANLIRCGIVQAPEGSPFYGLSGKELEAAIVKEVESAMVNAWEQGYSAANYEAAQEQPAGAEG